MQLDYMRDGLSGADLGVVGECQYALSFVGRLAADVWRRPASQVGTYGGWRWECASSHPARFPGVPLMVELAGRIESAMQDRAA
jgi:hypothetical protein